MAMGQVYRMTYPLSMSAIAKAAQLAVLAGSMGLISSGNVLADDATILASCKNELKLSDSGCACVLDKVHSTLNEKQLTFFVAAISGDSNAMMQAQTQLAGNEMLEVTNFMTTTPQQCQNQ